jgi:hypothetical protein
VNAAATATPPQNKQKRAAGGSSNSMKNPVLALAWAKLMYVSVFILALSFARFHFLCAPLSRIWRDLTFAIFRLSVIASEIYDDLLE